ncbi:MAG: PAS domain S-box protein [Nitrospinae bacterium]|nr:PAS domain S-box protein [Nitrospinota bacterium]
MALATDLSSAAAARLDAARVELIYTQARMAALAGFVCALGLAAAVWGQTGGLALEGWLAAVTLFTAVRIQSVARYHALGPAADPGAWERRFHLHVLLQGILWGSATFLLFPNISLAGQAPLFLILAGITGGSVATYAISPWAPAAFIVPALTPIGLRFMLEGNRMEAVTGALTLFYILVLLLAARGLRHALTNALRLRFENIELLDDIHRASESLRSLSEAAFEGVIAHRDGVILDANQAALDLLGYRLDEVKGKNVLDFLPPDLRDVAREKIASGDERPYQTAAHDSHGVLRPIEVRARHILYRGEQTRMAVFRDLTDRLESERALREQVELMQVLIETIPSPVFLKDREGRFVRCNAAMERFFNKPKEAIIGNTMSNLAPPDQAALHADKERELLERPGSLTYEAPMVLDNGERRDVIVNKATFLRPDGSAGGVVGVFTDITGRKTIERDLRTLSNAIREADQMIMITGRNGVIEYINPAGERVTGYTLAEVKGQTPRLFKSGAHEPEFYRAMWATILSGRNWSGHVVNRRKSGERYDEEMTISPVRDADGAVTHFVAVKRDVSDRIRAQRDLMMAKERAERATRLKDKFVSLVAHDLRTPLTSVSGFATILSQELDHAMNADQRDLMERIRKGTDNMGRMIDDLLTLSRVQSGHITPHPAKVNARALAEDLIEGFRHTAARRGVILANDISPGLTVYADRALLTEVLRNLIENAIKFMRGAGRVIVSAVDGERTVVSVADNGPGIPADLLPHLFKSEVKTSTPGARGEVGTGLGLPLCHDIITASGGSITVESGPGKGTLFLIALPRPPA